MSLKQQVSIVFGKYQLKKYKQVVLSQFIDVARIVHLVCAAVLQPKLD